MLVAVISAYEEGSARMPELSVGAAELATMRRACLLYLADHGGVDAIRHDVVSIVVTGERQARLRHLIGVCQWAENRGRPGTSQHRHRSRKDGDRPGKTRAVTHFLPPRPQPSPPAAALPAARNT